MNTSPRLEQLLQFQAAQPGDAFILFALAKEHEKLGNKDAALEHYEKLVATSPDYVGTYYHLGRLQQALGQPDAAVATYKTGLAVANKLGDRHAYSELATAKLELVDEDE
jgi:tetratricopeptide (TPR) repeat protein